MGKKILMNSRNGRILEVVSHVAMRWKMRIGRFFRFRTERWPSG